MVKDCLIENEIKLETSNLKVNNKRSKKSFIKMYYVLHRPETYTGEGFINYTESNCYRSITDIYYLTKTKFKTTTFEEVVNIIEELIEDNDTKLVLSYCPDICKVVTSSRSDWYMPRELYCEPDSYDMNRETIGDDGYSLEDYMQMMGRSEIEEDLQTAYQDTYYDDDYY